MFRNRNAIATWIPVKNSASSSATITVRVSHHSMISLEIPGVRDCAADELDGEQKAAERHGAPYEPFRHDGRAPDDLGIAIGLPHDQDRHAAKHRAREGAYDRRRQRERAYQLRRA